MNKFFSKLTGKKKKEAGQKGQDSHEVDSGTESTFENTDAIVQAPLDDTDHQTGDGGADFTSASADVTPPACAAMDEDNKQADPDAGAGKSHSAQSVSLPPETEMETEGGVDASSFLGQILEEKWINGVLCFLVRWDDSGESFTEWIEDKVLREEFPNDVDKWEKEHMHLRKPMESEKVHGNEPQPEEESLERLISAHLKLAFNLLTESEELLLLQQDVVDGLHANDKAGLAKVMHAFQLGIPNSRKIDDLLDDVNDCEKIVRREAREVNSARIERRNQELDDVEHQIQRIEAEIRRAEDSLAVSRRSGSRKRSACPPRVEHHDTYTPPNMAGHADAVMALSVEAVWDSSNITYNGTSLFENLSQFGEIDKIYLHPDEAVPSALIIFTDRAGSAKALKADFQTLEVRRPGVGALKLYGYIVS